MNGRLMCHEKRNRQPYYFKAAGFAACPDATFMFGKGRGFWKAGLRGRLYI
jgi:hypothetical protein